MLSVENTLESIIRLAVMTCACDGEIHPDEDSLLKAWIATKPVTYSRCMNAAFNETLRQLKSKGIPLKKTCSEMADNVPVPLKYDAMELCLRIAQVDGVGADDEMRFLMSVGKWLDLDYDRFREMRDKILPSNIHENIDVDALLGLHPGMSNEECRKHLLREYKRWNQLTTHSDPRKRKQAQEMIDMIGKKRSELRDA